MVTNNDAASGEPSIGVSFEQRHFLKSKILENDHIPKCLGCPLQMYAQIVVIPFFKNSFDYSCFDVKGRFFQLSRV